MGKKQRRCKPRVFLIYPFGTKQYNSPEVFAMTVQTAYKLGFVPVVASCYLVSTEMELMDRQIAYRTLEGCDAALICYEEDATEQMFREIHAALIRQIPVIRSIALS